MIPDSTNSKPASPRKWRSSALRIAGIYALVSGIWIIASDTIMRRLVTDQAMVERISVFKGWFFVIVTAVMLWVLIRRLLLEIEDASKEVRNREAYIRAILDGTNEAIFVHDMKTGRILDVNLTACEMFGYRHDELCALPVVALSSGEAPFTQEEAMRFMRESATNPSSSVEWHARHSSGRLFWAEARARVITLGGEKRILVTGRDITARKKATAEIRKLYTAIEQCASSVVITDSRGVIEYANAATFQLTGYEESELLGRRPDVFKTGHTSPYEYRTLWKTILNGGVWRGEFLNRKKDGSTYWESASISSITDDAGKITHFLAVKEDISERKLAEEKLLRQESLLEDAGELAHIGGWEFDPATGKGAWSAEVARIHGLDPSEEVTSEIGLSFFQNESRLKIETAVFHAITHGTPYDLELELITRDGTKKWVRTIGRPVIRNGEVVKVRGSIQDVTERKRFEEELAESRLRLRALLARIQETRERERTRLAREVHDVLGQLITGMKMDLNWIERRLGGIENEDLRETLAHKISATTALTDSMVESVQKISRDLRPGVLESLGLMAAIQSEARLFGERTGISCKVIETADTDGFPPEISTNIFRIFQEILTNVARHAHADEVRISMKRENENLLMLVEDNGRGIDLEALKSKDSMGLLGMSERAELIGSLIEFAPLREGGTRVALTVPLKVL